MKVQVEKINLWEILKLSKLKFPNYEMIVFEIFKSFDYVNIVYTYINNHISDVEDVRAKDLNSN